MKILLVHQAFPGQYTHLVYALAKLPNYKIVGLGVEACDAVLPKNVNYIRYKIDRGNTTGIHPLALETESKVIRGSACAAAAQKLKVKGFYPDIICAHPGWGESLFLKDVWPSVPILSYQEFYYRVNGLDADFDPEFSHNEIWHEKAKIRMKNAYLNLILEASSWNVSPTHFQKRTYPSRVQNQISVIHDGIDTVKASPATQAVSIKLPDGTNLRKGDRIVTFINRTLEPARGYHTFIRSIPLLQELVPDSIIVIVGSTKGVSYGRECSVGEWKEYYFSELADQCNLSQIHFTGAVDHAGLIELLRLSACHVYLTYPFVLSWSLLEAMACGCKIVASKTAPVEEVIRDGINGILIDFFSPRELAESVADQLKSPGDPYGFGIAARETVLERYSITTCVPAHVKLIELVASGALDGGM